MTKRKAAIIGAVAACLTLLADAGRAYELAPAVGRPNPFNEQGARGNGGSKGRTVEVTYSTGISIGIQDVVTACVPGAPINSCVLVPALGNERFVSIEIVDASGLPVPAFVGPHDDDPSGQPICGTTTEPVPITSGIEAEVVLNALDPAVPCAGIATSGTVKLTFLKRR